MRFLFLSGLFALSGCFLQNYNSTSNDQRVFGGTTGAGGVDASTDAGQRFLAAQDVINNRCVSCHTGDHNAWAFYGPDDYLADGYVVPGDPNSSQLILMLQNKGGSMPREGAPLTDAELAALTDWIANLQ